MTAATLRTCLTAVTGALVGATLAAAPAQAADSQSDFGQHVTVCAQTMGFDGTHNPGMHQGITNWDPSHSCPMA